MSNPRMKIPRENFQRASYLYQAAHVLEAPLQREYIHSMDLINKKTQLKQDPQLKRTICKECDRLLITHGQIRLHDEGKKSETLVITCKCGAVRRYPVGINREYKLFTEQEKEF